VGRHHSTPVQPIGFRESGTAKGGSVGVIVVPGSGGEGH
jgi:hypothetical protein